LNCPNCSKESPLQAAIFCPYCSKPLNVTKKRSGFLTSAGIFTIIAAPISLLIGILGYASAAIYSPYESYLVVNVLMGFFGILAFALGLIGGILTLKRKHFALSITGISLVLVSGIIVSVVIPYGCLVFGIPVMILSILGVTFTSISNKEFA
jgi:hypothetical protein